MSAERPILENQQLYSERTQQEIEEDSLWAEYTNYYLGDEIIDVINDQTVLPQFRRKALEYSFSEENQSRYSKYKLQQNLGNLEEGSELSLLAAKNVKDKMETVLAKGQLNEVDKLGLEKWNSLIPSLLKSLPESEAEELFDYFQEGNLREESSHSEIEVLYQTEGIDEKWKIKAAQRVHFKIRNELDKKEQSNNSNEAEEKPYYEDNSAFDRYRIVLNRNYIYDQNKSLLSEEFVQNELRFLMDTVPGEQIFKYNRGILYRMDELFKDKKFLHRLMRNELLNGKKEDNSWVIVNSQILRIVDQFSEDIELRDHVNSLKNEQDNFHHEIDIRNERIENERNAMFAKIRKPQ